MAIQTYLFCWFIIVVVIYCSVITNFPPDPTKGHHALLLGLALYLAGFLMGCRPIWCELKLKMCLCYGVCHCHKKNMPWGTHCPRRMKAIWSRLEPNPKTRAKPSLDWPMCRTKAGSRVTRAELQNWKHNRHFLLSFGVICYAAMANW